MIYKAEHNNIDLASQFILEGKIIIYPTDTIYGFGVDATNSVAINDLNRLKNRTSPYSIIVDSFDMLKKYSITDQYIDNELKKIFPGPYTAILKKQKSNLSKLVTLNLDTVGIRIPDHSFIKNVVSNIGNPVITTSINKHGNPFINNVDKIINQYNNINIFTNMISSQSTASTIIDFSVNPYKILRKGEK